MKKLFFLLSPLIGASVITATTIACSSKKKTPEVIKKTVKNVDQAKFTKNFPTNWFSKKTVAQLVAKYPFSKNMAFEDLQITPVKKINSAIKFSSWHLEINQKQPFINDGIIEGRITFPIGKELFAKNIKITCAQPNDNLLDKEFQKKIHTVSYFYILKSFEPENERYSFWVKDIEKELEADFQGYQVKINRLNKVAENKIILEANFKVLNNLIHQSKITFNLQELEAYVSSFKNVGPSITVPKSIEEIKNIVKNINHNQGLKPSALGIDLTKKVNKNLDYLFLKNTDSKKANTVILEGFSKYGRTKKAVTIKPTFINSKLSLAKINEILSKNKDEAIKLAVFGVENQKFRKLKILRTDFKFVNTNLKRTLRVKYLEKDRNVKKTIYILPNDDPDFLELEKIADKLHERNYSSIPVDEYMSRLESLKDKKELDESFFRDLGTNVLPIHSRIKSKFTFKIDKSIRPYALKVKYQLKLNDKKIEGDFIIQHRLSLTFKNLKRELKTSLNLFDNASFKAFAKSRIGPKVGYITSFLSRFNIESRYQPNFNFLKNKNVSVKWIVLKAEANKYIVKVQLQKESFIEEIYPITINF